MNLRSRSELNLDRSSLSNRLVTAGIEAVNEFGRAYSPPCKGGVSAAIKKWSRSEQARTGWSFASDVSECVLKHLRVSDHPVCGAEVASRLFIDAAATPPHEEGNAPRLNNLRIPNSSGVDSTKESVCV